MNSPQKLVFGVLTFSGLFCLFFSIFTLFFGNIIFASSSPHFSTPETMQYTQKYLPYTTKF